MYLGATTDIHCYFQSYLYISQCVCVCVRTYVRTYHLVLYTGARVLCLSKIQKVIYKQIYVVVVILSIN